MESRMSQPSVHINKSFLLRQQLGLATSGNLMIPKIFVNPNFTPAPLSPISTSFTRTSSVTASNCVNQKIHVNPKVFPKTKASLASTHSKLVSRSPPSAQTVAVRLKQEPLKQRTVLSTRTKLIRVNSVPSNSFSYKLNRNGIVSTRSRVVVNNSAAMLLNQKSIPTAALTSINTLTKEKPTCNVSAEMQNKCSTLLDQKNMPTMIQPTVVQHAEVQKLPNSSLHSKYKIVRTFPKNVRELKFRKHNRKVCCFKTSFAIDYRSYILKSGLETRRATCNNKQTQLAHRNASCTSQNSRNKKCVRIDGVLYKKSNFTLVQSNKQRKCNLVTIKGRIYKYDTGRKTLTLFKSMSSITQTKLHADGLKKHVQLNKSPKRMFSQIKQRGINLPQNKLRKSNIPCPFFRKYGRCKGKENKTCSRVHNPDQILLCPKFLQGACTNTKCLLSHNVSAEKMPTCMFFLEGICFKDDCPYPHVKVNAKEEICRDFIEGFCKKATECGKRHQYLCPDYEKYGSCKKPRCSYPHGQLVRTVRFAREISTKLRSSNEQLQKKKNIARLDRNKGSKLEQEKPCNRYYKGSELSDGKAGESNDASQCSSNSLFKRPQFGKLPSFIPLHDES